MSKTGMYLFVTMGVALFIIKPFSKKKKSLEETNDIVETPETNKSNSFKENTIKASYTL